MAISVDGQTDNHSDSGLMVPEVGHPNQNEDISQENIDQMVEQGKGPVEQERSIWSKIKSFLGF